MQRRQFGAKAEAAAAKYYINRGYRLLAHNYTTRFGELDVVLEKGEWIIVVEVKARSKPGRYAPREAVNAAKQQRIILAATRFAQQYGYTDRPMRFDVVEVTPNEKGFLIHCIQEAFEA